LVFSAASAALRDQGFYWALAIVEGISYGCENYFSQRRRERREKLRARSRLVFSAASAALRDQGFYWALAIVEGIS
jgi:predicted metal-binding protein